MPTVDILGHFSPPSATMQLGQRLCAVRMLFQVQISHSELYTPKLRSHHFLRIFLNLCWDFHCFLRLRWSGTMLYMNSQWSLMSEPGTLISNFLEYALSALSWLHNSLSPLPTSLVLWSCDFHTCLMQLESLSDQSSGTCWWTYLVSTEAWVITW